MYTLSCVVAWDERWISAFCIGLAGWSGLALDPLLSVSVERMYGSKDKGSNRGRMSLLRTGILVGICLQNAGYTLLRKYSTQYEHVSSKEILLVSEIIKVLVSVFLTLTDTETTDAQGKGVNKLIWLMKHSSKMLVLAAIYGAMNILSFVALNYIGAGEFTICAQVCAIQYVHDNRLNNFCHIAQNFNNCSIFCVDFENFVDMG